MKQLRAFLLVFMCLMLVVLSACPVPVGPDGTGTTTTTGSGSGYYITGGKAIPVTWEKAWDTDPTVFYDSNGDEITLNTGKTYIGLVSSKRWSELVIK